MLERLKVNFVTCYRLFQYRAMMGRNHGWLLWKKGRPLTDVLSPEDVKAKFREVQKGGIHNRHCAGKAGDTTKRLVATRSAYWIIYAYVPCRTKKGYFVWRRWPERSRPMTNDELVNSKYLEMRYVHLLHNVRLKPDEVIQVLAEEGANK